MNNVRAFICSILSGYLHVALLITGMAVAKVYSDMADGHSQGLRIGVTVLTSQHT